jgi:hypothetical protein
MQFINNVKEVRVEEHPFDKVINSKVNKKDNAPPKFTFETQELYGQATHLC